MKEECPNCRAKVSRKLPLAVNIAIQEFITENAGPMILKRKAEKSEAFYKTLVERNPVAALAALTSDVDLSRFVGDAALKLTPLLWACKNATDEYDLVDEWNDLIKALLAAGVDAVNVRDSEGKSALYLAASCNHATTDKTAIPALLDRGARDPSALSVIVSESSHNLDSEDVVIFDATLLRMVVDASYTHVTLVQKRKDLKKILNNGYDHTAVGLFDLHVRLEVLHKMLLFAAVGGCPLFIRKLLAAEVVPVDYVFENKQTALHIACQLDQADVALALLECGASNFLFDDFTRTPLDYAEKNEMDDVIEALKAKGCTD